jgi:hypothetical protein
MGSGSGSGSASASATGFAKPLRGPYATIDAYCETRPKPDVHSCKGADIAATGGLPTGLLEATAIYDRNDPDGDIGCSVALRTAAGWFVGPPSLATCSEPSYIDLEAVDIDTEGAIAAITFGVKWHTKSGDEEASYKLTALCGIGGSGIPACTPVFLRECEARAPVSGCDAASFELTWTLDGDSATFTRDRTIDNETVPTGTQRILGGP